MSLTDHYLSVVMSFQLTSYIWGVSFPFGKYMLNLGEMCFKLSLTTRPASLLIQVFMCRTKFFQLKPGALSFTLNPFCVSVNGFME